VTSEEQGKFAAAVLKLYTESGFSSPSKREVDLLVFHHITQASENKKKTNYELAAILKLPESRIKTFRLTSALKYQNINSKAILGRIILRLSESEQFSSIENNKIEISLEDPIEKRELENFLKSSGHHAEYTFNAEVLRIAPIRLFELIVENMEKGEDQFKLLVQKCIDDDAMSKRIMGDAQSLKQRFARLRKEIMNPSMLASLLHSAVKAFVI
jgi:hypothetical protein